MKIYELVKIINKEFGKPYFPKGFIQAKYDDDGFNLKIGKRDIYIDNNGKVLGTGFEVNNIPEE